MTVHTYHEALAGFERAEILELWAESWRRHGWTPQIHTRAEATAHPQAAAYESAIARLPTVNSRGYEDACWRRWLVAAQVGGFWCDDDLVNVGFTVDLARDGMAAPGDGVAKIIAWHDGAHPNAGLMLGTQQHFQKLFVDRVLKGHGVELLDSINGAPHTSDMYLWHLLWLAGLVRDVRRVMDTYGKPGALTAKLIHCSYDATTARGTNRLAAMRELVKQNDRTTNNQ